MRILSKFCIYALCMGMGLVNQLYSNDIHNLKICEDEIGNKLVIIHERANEGSIKISWKSLYDEKWNEPVEVSGNELYPNQPTFSINNQGNMVLVWLGVDPEFEIIRLYSSSAQTIGSSWTKPITISTDTQHIKKFELKKTSDEKLVLLWTASEEEKDKLFTSIGQFDGTWSIPEELPFNP